MPCGRAAARPAIGPPAGPESKRQRRRFSRHLRRHHAAVGLHDQQRARKTGFAQAALQLRQIMIEDRPHIGVERGGADAIVEADGGQQLGRCGEERAGQFLAHQSRGFRFVRRIGEGVHEADRHRLDVFRLEQLDGAAHVVELQRFHRAAMAVEAFGHADSQIARHHRRHIGVAVVVALLANAAAHFQRVAHARCCNEPGLGAAAGQRGVGRHRGAVDDHFDAAEKVGERERCIERAGQLAQSGEHADRRIRRCRQHLMNDRLAAGLADIKVGERAADVDADLEAPRCCWSRHPQSLKRVSACAYRRRSPPPSPYRRRRSPGTGRGRRRE